MPLHVQAQSVRYGALSVLALQVVLLRSPLWPTSCVACAEKHRQIIAVDNETKSLRVCKVTLTHLRIPTQLPMFWKGISLLQGY